MMVEGTRLRLRFDESCGLGEDLTADGLLQWWFSVPPSMRTIADVAAGIVSVFQLQRSCPRGVFLLMEDFALLPRQSVSLLKDRDLVSVKPKGRFPKARAQLNQTTSNQYITHTESNGPQVFRINAIEEFEKESGGYRSEDEDFGLNRWNEDHSTEYVQNLNGRALLLKGEESGHVEPSFHVSKRKKYGDSKDKQQDSRKRKNRHCPKEFLNERDRETSKKETKKSVGTSELASSDDDLKAAKRRKKENCKDGNEKKKTVRTSKNADVLGSDEDLKAAKRRKGKDTKKDREKVVGTLKTADVVFSDETPAKRRKQKGNDSELLKDQTVQKDMKPEEYPREDTKNEREEQNFEALSSEDDVEEDLHLTSRVEELDGKTDAEAVKGKGESQLSKGPSRSARRKKAKRQWLRRQAELNKKADGSEDIPNNEHTPLGNDGKENGSQIVMVAPGHVRFEPLDSDEENAVKLPMPVVNLGTEFKSKRHGQSWGRERPSGRQENNIKMRQRWENDTPECQDEECNERVQMQLDDTSRIADISFEELPQLQGSPKEGDVLAYKLVELSLTRTPELSSFRVGEVACFDRSSNHIKMVPVPQYPIEERRQDDEWELSESYQEDGSLEIDFSFLLDVRVLKRAFGGDAAGKLEDAPSPAVVEVKHGTSMQLPQNKTVTGEWADWVTAELEKKKQELSLKAAKPSGDEEVKFGSAMKAQTSQDIPLAIKSGKSDRWRLKSLKAAALGPTVALLRAQYDKEHGSNPVSH